MGLGLMNSTATWTFELPHLFNCWLEIRRNDCFWVFLFKLKSQIFSSSSCFSALSRVCRKQAGQLICCFKTRLRQVWRCFDEWTKVKLWRRWRWRACPPSPQIKTSLMDCSVTRRQKKLQNIPWIENSNVNTEAARSPSTWTWLTRPLTRSSRETFSASPRDASVNETPAAGRQVRSRTNI